MPWNPADTSAALALCALARREQWPADELSVTLHWSADHTTRVLRPLLEQGVVERGRAGSVVTVALARGHHLTPRLRDLIGELDSRGPGLAEQLLVPHLRQAALAEVLAAPLAAAEVARRLQVSLRTAERALRWLREQGLIVPLQGRVAQYEVRHDDAVVAALQRFLSAGGWSSAAPPRRLRELALHTPQRLDAVPATEEALAAPDGGRGREAADRGAP